MQPKERLNFCKICTSRKFDDNRGIVCMLTNNKPTFEVFCPDYKVDEDQVNRINSSEVKKELSKSFLKGAIIGTLVIIIYVIIHTIQELF